MREAMAQREETPTTEQAPEIETPRSAMNTVDVTINSNTPPPPLPHINAPEPANATAIDQVAAPTPAQDDAVASEVVSQIAAAPPDETTSGEQPTMGEPASSEASQPAEPASSATDGGETATTPQSSAASDTADSSAATSEPTGEATGGEVVTGESFAASGTGSDENVPSTLEANEAPEQAVSDVTASAEQAGSDTTTHATQGRNASDNATEETGTGSEAASQHGEAGKTAASEDAAHLEWVHGVGPKYNQLLGSAGIRTTEDLANATQEQLRAVGFVHESDEELNNWIQQAKDKTAGGE
ncbi:MAG: hypothetical protein DLM69_01020 [Candidatus Chloroheliales bacterium]|nr:MAG: hypothetical protein DLM69_01020 [Chloroflexota bacterium]